MLDRLACGYFLQDVVLVRKWVQHSGSFVGDPVFQIVLALKLCQSVLKDPLLMSLDTQR